jgi:hypothetical protein
MPLSTPVGGSLGSFNAGLTGAIALLNPLSANLDLLISLGLGPYQADLSVQFNAALSASATLTLQISDPLANLRLAISAVAQLQAALQAALSLPTITIGLSAELSASMALAGALSFKLGGIKLLLEAAIQIKIAAMKFVGDLQVGLSLLGAAAFSFSGDPMDVTGGQIQALFAGPIGPPGQEIQPTDIVHGVVLMTKLPAVKAALNVIIPV